MSRVSLFTALSLSAAILAAQPALEPPQLGLIQAADHSLRPVYGIAGNFVLGDSTAPDVVSAAFSGSLGLIKTDSSLLAVNARSQVLASIDAPAGDALFGFSPDGASALIYMGSPAQLFRWSKGTFSPVGFDAASLGRVSAIAFPDYEHAAFIIQRDEGLWNVRVSLSTGTVDSETALLVPSGPVLPLASDAVIFLDQDGIVIRKTDGIEMHVAAALPPHVSFQHMSQEWIQIRDLDSSSQFALRLTAGRESIYSLPEVEQ